MKFFGKLFKNNAPRADGAGPTGYRAYAIGDIHGRLDLLDALLAQIEADIAARGSSHDIIIFLGDLIDRGPSSAQVVERLRTYLPANIELAFLAGNHEEVLLRVLDGEAGLLPDWLKFGGADCARSYGIEPLRLGFLGEAGAVDALRAAIPEEHRTFLASFGDTFRFGDYLFVHAGIRPGLALSDQSPDDLRWIRSAFLDDVSDHGFIVVHGHTISTSRDERLNRIGIDTGAYRTGILTALAIEGEERWFLDTSSEASEN